MKLFVWDFHGVLEKGNEMAVKVTSSKALEQLGFDERFTLNDCINLYGKKWYEYFEYLLPSKSIEIYFSLQDACYKIQAKYNFIKKYIKPNDNANFVLTKIRESEHEQILISNTHPDAMNIFLDAVKLTAFFPENKCFGINSHSNITLNKKDTLRNFLENKKYDKIIIIGDSPADIDLKSVAGGLTYLYSHPEKKFRVCESDYKINCLKEIIKEL